MFCFSSTEALRFFSLSGVVSLLKVRLDVTAQLECRSVDGQIKERVYCQREVRTDKSSPALNLGTNKGRKQQERLRLYGEPAPF